MFLFQSINRALGIMAGWSPVTKLSAFHQKTFAVKIQAKYLQILQITGLSQKCPEFPQNMSWEALHVIWIHHWIRINISICHDLYSVDYLSQSWSVWVCHKISQFSTSYKTIFVCPHYVWFQFRIALMIDLSFSFSKYILFPIRIIKYHRPPFEKDHLQFFVL